MVELENSPLKKPAKGKDNIVVSSPKEACNMWISFGFPSTRTNNKDTPYTVLILLLSHRLFVKRTKDVAEGRARDSIARDSLSRVQSSPESSKI